MPPHSQPAESRPSPLVDRYELCALIELWKERFRVNRREAYRAVTKRLDGLLEHPFTNLGGFERWRQSPDNAIRISNRKLEITLAERFGIGDGGEGERVDEPLHSLSDDRLTPTKEETMRDLSRSESREFIRRNREALDSIEKRICSDPALRRKVCAGYLRWLALVSRRR